MVIHNEAKYYNRHNDDNVKCNLCPHNCLIKEGNIGICKVRKNINGKLITLNYNKITATNMDPIEKKPLYHFYPNSYIFSVGSFGCNLKCSFCQNFDIAHYNPEYVELPSDELVDVAKGYNESVGIAFTYNEPSIWYEYVYETAVKAKDNGLKTVLVSNGFISKEPLIKLLPYIDAMNIDLKSYSNKFYKNICGGNIDHVLNTIEICNEYCHVEISTLLIENYNTDNEEIEKLSKFLSKINKNIPLHLNRYYPAYKMNEPPTNIETIKMCADIAKKHLNYVFIGNVQNVDNNTYCPSCNNLIVTRGRYTDIVGLSEGSCNACGEDIKIII